MPKAYPPWPTRDGLLKRRSQGIPDNFWPVVVCPTVFDTSRVGGDGVVQVVLDGTVATKDMPTIVMPSGKVTPIGQMLS